MKRYRQTMVVTIDVLAENVDEATRIAQENYENWDTVGWWQPDQTVEVPESDEYFSPVNEDWLEDD